MDYISACAGRAWTLQTWPKAEPWDTHESHFRCGSWRHAGPCRQFKGAQDFVRIKEAIESHRFWMHIVLTYPTWVGRDIAALYRHGLRDWSKLRKRTQRRYGDYKYIQVWEQTRKGFPHCHMAVSCARLFDGCGLDPIKNFHGLLRDQATASGFGKIGWCEPIRSAGAMAGYLGKLCREMTGCGKDYQIPTNAPKGFRRLRASVRLLPPVAHNPEITGFLWFCDLCGEVQGSAGSEGGVVKAEGHGMEAVAVAVLADPPSGPKMII